MENNFLSRLISFFIFFGGSILFLIGFLFERNNYIFLILAILFFGFGVYILFNEDEDKIESIKKFKN